MKLSHKLIAGYVVIAITTAATGIIGIITSTRLESSYEELALGGLPIHTSLDQLRFAGLRIVSSTSEAVVLLDEKEHSLPSDYFHGGSPETNVLLEELKLIDSGKALFYKALGKYASVVNIYAPDETQHISAIEQLAKELLEKSFNLIVAKKTAAQTDSLTSAKEEFEKSEKAYLLYLDNIITGHEDALERELRNNIHIYKRTAPLFIFLATGSLIAAFAFGILQAKAIAASLARLTSKVKLIGQGRLDQRVQITSADELADLATTFNQMAADLQQSGDERDQARQGLQHYAAQLERNSQEMQEIVYVASHDLQEPMRKIMTSCERLALGYNHGAFEDAPKHLLSIGSTAKRMRRLLDDLLEYSRLVRCEPVIQKIALKNLLQVTEEKIFKKFAPQTLALEYEPNLPEIRCDERLMETVFFNLFENAVKFARPEEKLQIKITSSTASGFHRILVADNGQGFMQKYEDRIFGIFEKLHTDNNYEGTGMGLAFCRKILEKHRGSIEVSSQEGIGSIFTLILPE